MLDAQMVEAELLADPSVTILKKFDEFGWAVEVRIGDVPIPARIGVSGAFSEQFVMFWAKVASATVPEAFIACDGLSNAGIASDGEGGYQFRAAILKPNSLPSAIPSSLRSIAAASLRYQMDLLLGDDEPTEKPASQ